MEYSNIAEELNREYERRRQENFALYVQHQREACQKCPGLEELLNRRHALVLTGIRGILQGGAAKETPPADEMRGLNEQIRALLKKGGLAEDFLKPVYTCPLCKDEGFLYNPNRTMCECYQKALTQKMLLRTASPHHNFEAFDEMIFSSEDSSGDKQTGMSQRRRMQYNKAICQEYAETYPNCVPPNILMMGKSGLGKTYLMECIAHRLAERGFVPVMRTAYQLFDTLRKAFFDNDRLLDDELITTDLLFIDDLGTEPLLNNITVEMLFRLVDERGRAGLHTIISTNLNRNELRERYTERVTSRLNDPVAYRPVYFFGSDVRKPIKGAAT